MLGLFICSSEVIYEVLHYLLLVIACLSPKKLVNVWCWYRCSARLKTFPGKLVKIGPREAYLDWLFLKLPHIDCLDGVEFNYDILSFKSFQLLLEHTRGCSVHREIWREQKRNIICTLKRYNEYGGRYHDEGSVVIMYSIGLVLCSRKWRHVGYDSL